MAGVYAYGESKDYIGNVFKVEIYDTTFSGTSNTFTLADNAFTLSYSGITDKLHDVNLFTSSVTVKVMITENDSAMLALIPDLAAGTEDQFYIRILKNNAPYFYGLILTDTCQYADESRFVFEINATDGLNRLEYFLFDYATDSACPDFLPMHEVITRCLVLTGTNRFFGNTDSFLASAINWYEIDQRTTYGPLYDTRISRESLYEDLETMRPRTCKEVLQNILQTFAANIRFDDGMWRVLQPENNLGNNISYHVYDKQYNYKTSISYSASEEINNGIDLNTAINPLVNYYVPSMYLCEATIQAESRSPNFGGNKLYAGVDLYEVYDLSVGASHTKANSYFAITPTPMVLHFEYWYNVGYVNPGDYYSYFITIENGPWRLKGSYNPSDPLSWKLISQWTANDVAVVYTDYPPVGNTLVRVVKAELNIPEVPANAGSFTITTALRWRTGSVTTFLKGPHYFYAALNSTDPTTELYFGAKNNVLNAASFSIKKDLYYGDISAGYIVNALQIYTGTEWKQSAQWADNTTATEGITIQDLWCRKNIYFQRYPRKAIQGKFIIPGFTSQKTIVWRSVRYLFLQGSYDHKTCQVSGTWCALLQQSSDVVLSSNNPFRGVYRNRIVRDGIRGDIGGIRADINDIRFNINDLTTQINNLKKNGFYGLTGGLTYDIDGLDGMADSDTKTLTATKTTSDDGSNKITITWA